MHRRVGIVGVPPLSVIRKIHEERFEIIDLDEPQVREPIDLTAPYLPRVYCAVLRTVVLNAMHLDLDEIFIDVGPGKCDCALHVATILDDMLEVPITRTRNQDMENFGYPISRSQVPLLDKLLAITRGVQSTAPYKPLESCRPAAGFWGVPPRDFSILSLFPDTTHVYGWTRCMENKTPANLQLEAHVNLEVPTVFFAQSFCAKTALAKHLADRHPRALYLDCDVTAGSSTRAKIEAFLELSGVKTTDREAR
ncbi:MAG: hypothetical protein GQ559_00710 [Desulfobulbaceae bacterium]|nr:hypothetical protein [Desulfobulbaceae bacterium]